MINNFLADTQDDTAASVPVFYRAAVPVNLHNLFVTLRTGLPNGKITFRLLVNGLPAGLDVVLQGPLASGTPGSAIFGPILVAQGIIFDLLAITENIILGEGENLLVSATVGTSPP